MKKIILYALVLAAVLVWPEQGTDIGKLLPVEALEIGRQGTGIIIRTDTGNTGSGKTVDEAIEDLKHTASGEIYLDTAAYLLVCEGDEALLEKIRPYVKPSIRLCQSEGLINLREVPGYLAIHEPSVKMKTWETGQKLEKLTQERGRLELIRKI